MVSRTFRPNTNAGFATGFGGRHPYQTAQIRRGVTFEGGGTLGAPRFWPYRSSGLLTINPGNFPMDDLFAEAGPAPGDPVQANAPLAARMRPQSLEEFVGQDHILGPGKLLRRAIESDRLNSIILYRPPGVGKTSLAPLVAKTTSSHFERLSGVESSVADIRKTVAAAKLRLKGRGTRTILFVDEIHRFNKAQQDVLLPDVESGVVRLIGATTHNPFFYVNSPLVSRSQIFELRPLSEQELYELLRRALADADRGLGHV